MLRTVDVMRRSPLGEAGRLRTQDMLHTRPIFFSLLSTSSRTREVATRSEEAICRVPVSSIDVLFIHVEGTLSLRVRRQRHTRVSRSI